MGCIDLVRCVLMLCCGFSLHMDTTPPQPNHNVTPTHIEPDQYNPWNNSTNKSQAPEDGCINIRNMLSIKYCNNKASDIKLVSLYSTIKMMHGPINIRYCAVNVRRLTPHVCEIFMHLHEIYTNLWSSLPRLWARWWYKIPFRVVTRRVPICDSLDGSCDVNVVKILKSIIMKFKDGNHVTL